MVAVLRSMGTQESFSLGVLLGSYAFQILQPGAALMTLSILHICANFFLLTLFFLYPLPLMSLGLFKGLRPGSSKALGAFRAWPQLCEVASKVQRFEDGW